jgi:hypothetical protein
VSHTVSARCLVILGEGKCSSDETCCMYVLVFLLLIYLLCVLIASAVSVLYHTALCYRTISAERIEQNSEGGIRGLIWGGTYDVAIFGTDWGEATKVSQGNQPEVLKLGASKYGAGVLLPRSVVCAVIFSLAQGLVLRQCQYLSLPPLEYGTLHCYCL